MNSDLRLRLLTVVLRISGVSYVAIMNLTFGPIMLAIDVHAGLPRIWTALEGPSIAAVGVVVALLNRGGQLVPPAR